MEEWKEYKVAEVIEDISMGPFGSNIKRDNYVDFGVPYLNGSNLSSYKLNENSFNYVTEEKANNLGRCVAKRGDIIVTHRGTIGQISYIPNDSIYERYLTGNSQFRLTVNRKVIRPDFFVYYFHTRMGQYRILANASQVGVPALARPTSTFKEVLVPVPKMEVQNKIMDILLSLDDKIAVNRRICENLEAQAQALFKHWFIDFAPFKNGKFVESKLGMIPEGWRVGTLGDIANIIMGQSPSGSSYNENGEGVLFYQGRTEFGFRFPSIRLFTTEPKRFAEPLSTLLSVRAPVGDINIATEKCCIGRGLASIKSKNSHYSYIYYLLLSMRKRFNVFNGEGTVFGSINKDSLNGMNIIIPPFSATTKFDEIVKMLDKRILKAHQENLRLSTLRDTLLPKLMSGQIKV